MATLDFRRILCPLDFSAASEGALRAAVDLTVRYQAALTLLHVEHVPGSTIPEGLLETSAAISADPEAPDARALTEWRERALRLGASQVEALHSVGDPATEIVEAARTFDVVVMGTHGRAGAARVIAGSVAEEVVRYASCPVLTVGLEAARHLAR